jgi:hypothetical protein
MVQLKRFADQARPTFADFAEAAPNITRSTKALGPFAKASTPALLTLGDAAQKSTQPLLNSDPTLVRIRNLAQKTPPAARGLSKILSSLQKTHGYPKLMHLIYNTTGGINGFDKFGHFLRATLQVTNCTTLQSVPDPSGNCAANWDQGSQFKASPQDLAAAILAQQGQSATSSSAGGTTAGTPLDAAGDLAGASSPPSNKSAQRKPHAPSLSDARDLLNTIIGTHGHPDGSGASSGQYTTPSDQGGTSP